MQEKEQEVGQVVRSMSKRTYHIDIDGGFSDTELSNVRRKAIDHLWTNPRDEEVVVWSSPSKKRVVVGRVVYTSSNPLFLWVRGRKARTLYRTGNVYHKPM